MWRDTIGTSLQWLEVAILVVMLATWRARKRYPNALAWSFLGTVGVAGYFEDPPRWIVGTLFLVIALLPLAGRLPGLGSVRRLLERRIGEA